MPRSKFETERRDKRITFRLTDDLFDRATRQAQRLGCGRNRLASEGLEHLLERLEATEQATTPVS